MQYLRFTFLMLTSALIFSNCEQEDSPSLDKNTIDKELILKLVNDYRASGCNCGTEFFDPVNLLVWDEQIELAALNHSIDMDENAFLDHTGSDGSNVGDRLDRANYPYSTWGENIANGYSSEQAVVEGWINSVGHCKNIMNGNFEDMGAAQSGSYWTLVFGKK